LRRRLGLELPRSNLIARFDVQKQRSHFEGVSAGGGQKGFGNPECALKKTMTFPGERTVAGNLPVIDGLLNELKLVPEKKGRLNGMIKESPLMMQTSVTVVFSLARLATTILTAYKHDTQKLWHSHRLAKEQGAQESISAQKLAPERIDQKEDSLPKVTGVRPRWLFAT